MKYEYKFTHVAPDELMDAAVTRLNEAGQEGWQIVYVGGGVSATVIWLMRESKPKQDQDNRGR